MVRNARTELPINPWKMEVSQVAGGQNLTDAAFNVIQWDTVNFDTVGGFANDVYTIPLDGFYVITARLSVNTPAVNGINQTFFISVFVNNVEVSRGQGGLYPQPAAGASSQNISSTVMPTIKLNAGDTIDIRGFPQVNGTATVPASVLGRSAYWAIHLLSG